MKNVEVKVDFFKDTEVFNKEITVTRNGEKIKLKQKLLIKGDIYEISEKRFKILSKKGIVEEVKPIKKIENKGE